MKKMVLLSENARLVLETRYLKKNSKGKVIESPEQMFKRVAKAVSLPDKKYRQNPKTAEKEFYDIMSELKFLPNSPTLMNAGTEKQMLSACFVLPIEDSLESIFTTLKSMALIEQVGGGVGFNFSALRSKGSMVGSTHGVASGPVSFMRIYDEATDVIKQGSRRRGAMMGILNANHPDIEEFITAKQKGDILNNFNLSVAVTDSFMKKSNNSKLFRQIAENAWGSGDPGLVFIDEINRKHPLKEKVESLNPCGEVALLPYESCNLGSINLSKFVKNNKVDFEELKKTIHTAVHFLDNVIDANKFPLKETEIITKANRKIGLGVMGFAEMLIQLNSAYDSDEAVAFAGKLMKFIRKEAEDASFGLAKKRGAFPNFKKSKLKRKLRNATVTSIAPTGAISIIAGTSSGIEPLFAVSFVREVLDNKKLPETNPLFEKIAKGRGFYSRGLMEEINKWGSVQKLNIPADVKRLFVTAHEIKPQWHVKIQAAFQNHVGNAVSKTVNLPSNASIEDVMAVYLLAWKMKCKGITVYRYGSRKEQVLYAGNNEIKVHHEFAGGCLKGECSF
ncbi:MAG: adenosylcobalamin-dependent ribonucleoside-diphosphate reductase [Nanoarchaeota archaeon]|nr:adenosylcobalamin-dependent ribonucleoside-diphosphate reductase [Nanoarchaeota archaeon]